jgi:nucleotide-binding universal stress UspA family protein
MPDATFAGMSFDKILVALDGSEREVQVLAAARELAERVDARLVLFRGVHLPVDVPREALMATPAEVQAMFERIARERLEALAAGLPPGLCTGCVVRIGSPWRAICDAGRELGADLIVIGSHGYGGLDRLLGTTAAKVVNHADRSVMVVRS